MNTQRAVVKRPVVRRGGECPRPPLGAQQRSLCCCAFAGRIIPKRKCRKRGMHICLRSFARGVETLTLLKPSGCGTMGRYWRVGLDVPCDTLSRRETQVWCASGLIVIRFNYACETLSSML